LREYLRESVKEVVHSIHLMEDKSIVFSIAYINANEYGAVELINVLVRSVWGIYGQGYIAWWIQSSELNSRLGAF